MSLPESQVIDSASNLVGFTTPMGLTMPIKKGGRWDDYEELAV